MQNVSLDFNNDYGFFTPSSERKIYSIKNSGNVWIDLSGSNNVVYGNNNDEDSATTASNIRLGACMSDMGHKIFIRRYNILLAAIASLSESERDLQVIKDAIESLLLSTYDPPSTWANPKGVPGVIIDELL